MYKVWLIKLFNVELCFFLVVFFFVLLKIIYIFVFVNIEMFNLIVKN